MNKRLSILHISDLHKPQNSSLDNLFYSLQRDCDEYVNEGILKPEIIVVSGDVVEGSKDNDAERIIRSQYKEVTSFLNKLTDYFLDGDKGRMVIVPGNHDYCYKTSIESMTISPDVMTENDLRDFKKAEPHVRWNWDDRRFYHITDIDRYDTRFNLFKSFYNDYYAGIRELPESVDRDSYIIELHHYRIALVCFNSCYRLDHLNPMGCICPDGLVKAHDRLAVLKKMGYLLIGVWHHHVSGLPTENNYMDYRILNYMIQEGIKIGLFGHQHVSTAIQEYRDITSEQSILLISSGSLFGNHHQLVTGVPRQYNVIELFQKNEDVFIHFNVRKDNSHYDFGIPQWIRSPIGIMNLPQYKHKTQIEKPQIELVLVDVEESVKRTANYGEACLRLMDLGLEDDRVLKYYDHYISMVKDNKLLKILLKKPRTIAQYISALNAAISELDKDWIVELLSIEQFQNETNAIVKEFKDKAKNIL